MDLRLQNGWGPSCEFLGKPVPKQVFPRIEERGVSRSRVSRPGSWENVEGCRSPGIPRVKGDTWALSNEAVPIHERHCDV